MFKRSAPKQTGIYRVSGNMADFQLEIKLRHISEWLPVPKFQYKGAKTNGKLGENYADSTLSSNWGDFLIYVPHEDIHGNHYNYYNYYNPGSGYPSSELASGCRSYASSSAFSGGTAATESTGDAATLGTNTSSPQSSQPSQLDTSHSGDSFSTLNKELCNGETANLFISWQQKHFSRTELERYGNAAQCVTPLQRRYHRWTQDIVALQQRHRRELERQQRLQKRLRRRRTRRRDVVTSEEGVGTDGQSLSYDDPNFAARTCLIHTLIDADFEGEELTDPELLAETRQLHSQGYQLMYVYAQLQRDTLLFTLRYAPAEGLLYVYPDFNCCADDMDYVLEIDNDCRQLYAYGFHNVTPLGQFREPKAPAAPPTPTLEGFSSDASLPPSEANAEELLSYYQRHRELAAERRRLRQFALPPKRMRRVALLLELREAEHFEYPNIHIRYYVNPPLNTLLEPSNPDDPFPLRGSTATCLAGGAERVARFSHCWQLTLLCEETYQPDQLLHIYFEVISIDSWQRERCEGYAHFSCSLLGPLPPNVVEGVRLQCIRPVGSWLDALNRYFIGGRTLFDFVGYFNGDSRSSALHSRLEADTTCATRGTGTLLFSLQKLQQRHLQVGYHLDMYDTDDDSQLKENLAPRTTLDEVLASYVEARDRIEVLLGRTKEHVL